MEFIEDFDPELIAQVFNWATLCTGVPGNMASTLAGMDFTSHYPLFTDHLFMGYCVPRQVLLLATSNKSFCFNST